MEKKTYGEAGIGNVTPETIWDQEEEFRDILFNLIKIHVVSEDHGADVFERSILKAPTPEFKMRMAKAVMEEYGHHLRFRALLDELDIDWKVFCKDKEHLTSFDVPIHDWTDQIVFLALVDRAAAHQFRHFVKSPYEPFRRACEETLNEEYGHVGLGMEAVKLMLAEPSGQGKIKAAVWKWLPVGLASFGNDKSRSSERFRYWGFKSASNEEMKAAYYTQVRAFIAKDWGIEIPEAYPEFLEMAGDNIPEQLTHIG
jgi:ring-1,2-phenylacetyl-CoA epoxidase subunit PaaA